MFGPKFEILIWQFEDGEDDQTWRELLVLTTENRITKKGFTDRAVLKVEW
jgi:hypothetical protein